MQPSLETELATLLSDLLAGQDELLAILTKKRQLLGAADIEGLSAIGPQEQRWIDALQECLRRREQLLARAAAEGLPADQHQGRGGAAARGRPPATFVNGSIWSDAAAGCCSNKAWSIGWSCSGLCCISRNFWRLSRPAAGSSRHMERDGSLPPSGTLVDQAG